MFHSNKDKYEVGMYKITYTYNYILLTKDNLYYNTYVRMS